MSTQTAISIALTRDKVKNFLKHSLTPIAAFTINPAAIIQDICAKEKKHSLDYHQFHSNTYMVSLHFLELMVHFHP